MEGGVDAIDLTAEMQFIQPDNNNENDKTVFRVPLPKPLPPGESVEIDINFTAKLPSPPFARTGAKEEYFFVGQWFPKIGVNAIAEEVSLPVFRFCRSRASRPIAWPNRSLGTTCETALRELKSKSKGGNCPKKSIF